MAFRPRTRKRVHAVRRAADGSAFEKCDQCSVMVPIALVDMHECGEKRRELKRFKGISGNQNNIMNQSSFNDQPRSPFCFFMENFMKSYETGNLIEIGRKGFEMWKKMSREERKPFIAQAEKLSSAYYRTLIEEVNGIYKVNDGADSAMVGKFDSSYENYVVSSDYLGSYQSGFESFHTHEWKVVKSLNVKKSDRSDLPGGSDSDKNTVLPEIMNDS